MAVIEYTHASHDAHALWFSQILAFALPARGDVDATAAVATLGLGMDCKVDEPVPGVFVVGRPEAGVWSVTITGSDDGNAVVFCYLFTPDAWTVIGRPVSQALMQAQMGEITASVLATVSQTPDEFREIHVALDLPIIGGLIN